MLKKFFNSLKSTAGEDVASTDHVHLAAAVLILDIAKSDFEWQEEERLLFVDLLQSEFALDMDQAQELKELAEDRHDRSASMHEFICQINAAYQPEAKIRLVYSMWQIAYADSVLHHYEEHSIRRVADLLHVPHREFMRLKHRAQQARDSST